MRGAHQLSRDRAWYRGATFMKFGRAAAIRWMIFGLKGFGPYRHRTGSRSRIERPDMLVALAQDYTRKGSRAAGRELYLDRLLSAHRDTGPTAVGQVPSTVQLPQGLPHGALERHE